MKRLACILTALAAAPAAIAANQAPMQPEPAVAAVAALQQELTGMRRSLDELVALVAATLDQQQMEVLMRRIELKQRGLQPLQTSLDRARRDREGMQEEVARVMNLHRCAVVLNPRMQAVTDRILNRSNLSLSEELKITRELIGGYMAAKPEVDACNERFEAAESGGDAGDDDFSSFETDWDEEL